MNKTALSSHVTRQILVEIILEKGYQPDDLCHLTGASLDQLLDPNEYIPLSSLLKIWQIAIDLTGDPALALHLRKSSGKKNIHFVGSLARSSKNLLEAAQHLARYNRIITNADKYDIIVTENIVKIVLTILYAEYKNRWIPEHHFGVLLETARSLVNWEVNPLEVHFQHSDPGYAEEYHKVFKAPVLFQQHENMFVFRKSDLLQPITSHDPFLEAALKNYADTLLNKTSKMGTLQGRLYEIIMSSLPNGNLECKKAAKMLNMDSSTLYRHLRREGTTFKDLLLSAKQDLAKTYLLQGMTCSQITYLLGYSEPAAFQRAFKRWFGMSPGKYKISLP
jgi:AraC-like DNA-binding protein